MGYKSVLIIDHDMLARAERDPEEFVRRLTAAILEPRRFHSVSMEGATVANVVWTGHSQFTPVLRIDGFKAEQLTVDEEHAADRVRFSSLLRETSMPSDKPHRRAK